MPTYGYEIEEISEGRSGGFTRDGNREYTRVFRVAISGLGDLDATVDPSVILRLTGVPRRGDLYASTLDGSLDTGARCLEVSCRPVSEAPWVWTVEAKYSTETRTAGEGVSYTDIEDPLMRPTIFEWGSVKTQVPLVEDRNGDSICNAAGDPFDPPAMRNEVALVLTMARNQAEFNYLDILNYEDHTNTDTWFNFPPETVYCESIKAKEVDEKGVLYWQVTYVFHIKARTWKFKLLNHGFRQVNAANEDGPLVAIRDPGTGSQITTPARLDEFGFELGHAEDPVFLEFDGYDGAEFTDLNLP